MERLRSLKLLLLSALAVGNAACFFPWSDPPQGPSLIYVLPQGFSGWVCVDFGVAGAPTLDQEGASFVIRAKEGDIIQTSLNPKDASFPTTDQVFEEVAGKRQALSIVVLRASHTESDTDYPETRHCSFFGTEDEAKAAGEAPRLVRMGKKTG